MPGQSALVVIEGLGDARVSDTLKRLQDARAHRDPNPYGKRAPGDAAKNRP
jgi:hypothetical protein